LPPPLASIRSLPLSPWTSSGIRTSGAFDGVIDFDAATRDPADPLRMLPAYDSGDHLHPKDAGYRAMAESIDLTLFRRSR
jgi:lysophospholipase L1-like esterase